jgi:hypothetical protein
MSMASITPARSLTLALLALAACRPVGATKGQIRAPGVGAASPGGASSGGSDLNAARELDQQGVRAFSAGRYRDAVMMFKEAHRLGGPPSELWNVSRALERLDQPEDAATQIEEYLGEKGLESADRAEAQRELARLKQLSSPLTAVSVPNGALLTIDGQAASGATPVTTEITAGVHTIAMRRDGYAPKSMTVEARFGRAVVVEIELEKASK